MEKTKYQILIQYFLDNFSIEMLFDQHEPTSWQEERARFYFEKILELDSVLQKIEKYSLYFSEFFPQNTEQISKSEALEYHWHSYIQDFYILKERISRLIGSLKNDIVRYDLANPEDAYKLLEHLKIQITQGLERASGFRSAHTHHKTARNFDLTRANMMNTLKTHVEVLNVDENLFNSKIEEFTERTRKEFIQMAADNNIEIQKMREFFAPRFGHLFASLYGHDISIFKMN